MIEHIQKYADQKMESQNPIILDKGPYYPKQINQWEGTTFECSRFIFLSASDV